MWPLQKSPFPLFCKATWHIHVVIVYYMLIGIVLKQQKVGCTVSFPCQHTIKENPRSTEVLLAIRCALLMSKCKQTTCLRSEHLHHQIRSSQLDTLKLKTTSACYVWQQVCSYFLSRNPTNIPIWMWFIERFYDKTPRPHPDMFVYDSEGLLRQMMITKHTSCFSMRKFDMRQC